MSLQEIQDGSVATDLVLLLDETVALVWEHDVLNRYPVGAGGLDDLV
jgi:hypothetical protein